MVKTKKISLVIVSIFVIPVLFIATASMAVTVTVQNSGGSSVSTTYYTQDGDHASGDANLVNGTVNVTTSGSVERGLIRTHGGDGSRDFCPFTGDFEAGGTATGDSAGTTSSCTDPRVNIFIVSQNPDYCQNCCASVYDKIQDTVDDTPGAGDSWVLVDEGTYQGAEIGNKNNLSLESVWGAADTIVDGREGGGTTLYAHDSTNLSIDGFTITGGTDIGYNPGGWAAGLDVINCDSATIQNNTVTGNWRNGINVIDYTNVTIKNNTFAGNGRSGVIVASGDTVEIENNTVTNNLIQGIHVSSSNNATIKYNTTTDNMFYGIVLYESDNATIENNSVTNNAGGIHLSSSNSATIKNNTVADNVLSGIGLSGNSNNVSVNQNNIYGNEWYGLRNSQLNAVDASNNWWGHAPPDYEGNLGVDSGTPGKDIWDAGDNLVDYSSWATQPY